VLVRRNDLFNQRVRGNRIHGKSVNVDHQVDGFGGSFPKRRMGATIPCRMGSKQLGYP